MPVFPNKVHDLQNIGPIIEVVVFPSEPIFNKMRSDGLIPMTKKLIALIDTGASGSCIDNETAKELGFIARDVSKIQTPAGESERPVYDIGFALPGLQTNILPVIAVGIDLAKQPYDALIGRDILKFCTLVYNGWDNSYQLHM